MASGINDLKPSGPVADTTSRAAQSQSATVNLPATVQLPGETPRPRFYFQFGSVSLFADHLLLAAYNDRDTRGFYIGLAARAQDVEAHQEAVQVNLPVKDRAAYERTFAAFNAVMDGHQARKDARNERHGCGAQHGSAGHGRAASAAPGASFSTSRLSVARSRASRAARCRRS